MGIDHRQFCGGIASDSGKSRCPGPIDEAIPCYLWYHPSAGVNSAKIAKKGVGVRKALSAETVATVD